MNNSIKNMPAALAEVGVIHGRFQILHNDHLRYLLDGKERCRKLVVGITNPDPTHTGPENADPARDGVLANPLTYYERQLMVEAAFREAGLPAEAFSVVPFPINYPELYRYYLPLDALFFLTIYDDWGRRKRDYFQSLGLTVHILRDVSPEEKGISASDIRDRMINDRTWEHLVPRSVAFLLKEWNIAGRLKNKIRLTGSHR